MRTLIPLFSLAAAAMDGDAVVKDYSASIPYMYTAAGQAEWGGECQTSMKQSPIDVVESGMYESFEDDTFGPNWTVGVHDWLMQWCAGHDETLSMKLADLGPDSHAIKFTPDEEPEFCQDGVCIKLAQWHFHILDSEHAWNNELAFAEVHYVTYRSDKFSDLMDAVTGTMEDGSRGGNLRVFGYFIQPGDDANKSYKADEHFEQIGALKESNNFGDYAYSVPVNTIVSEDNSGGFARYEGGLTTPTCNELVAWTVWKDPIYIHPDTAAALASIPFNLQKNNRVVQPVNDRIVRFFKSFAIPAEGEDDEKYDLDKDDFDGEYDDNYHGMHYHLFNYEQYGSIGYWPSKDEQFCLQSKKGGRQVSYDNCDDSNKGQFFQLNKSGLQIQQGDRCLEALKFSEDDANDKNLEYPVVLKKCSGKKNFNWDQAFTYNEEMGCLMSFNNNDWCVTVNEEGNLVLYPCKYLGGRAAAFFGHWLH